jgi:Sap, sulfolipid-1-addressing protein
MWSSMAVLALPIALDPVRLGFNLLLISRPRPAQNLFVYWVTCATVDVLLLLVPILTLQFTPMFSSVVHDVARPATPASSAVRYSEIAAGVLVLLTAAFLAVRFLTRQPAGVPAQDGDTSAVMVDSEPPNPISRLLGRRLVRRATNAWENGSLWIAVAIGLWAAPSPAFIVLGLTTIVTSGAGIAAQVGAAFVFVAETLTVVEIVLLCNLVAPTKTEAVLRRLHDWTRAYRRQILVAMLTFLGLAMVAQGTGVL